MFEGSQWRCAPIPASRQLEAFEAFLEHYPEWIGNVVMIQVTTPTASDSPVIARKISRLVDHINVRQPAAVKAVCGQRARLKCHHPAATFSLLPTGHIRQSFLRSPAPLPPDHRP